MSYSYEYDQSGLASSYLALSFILPITIYFSCKMLFKKKISRINCKCENCRKLSSDKSFMGKFLILSLWIIVSILLKNVFIIKMEIKKDFDPLEILGIDLNTPVKVTKKKMVKLMLKYDVHKAPEDKKAEYEKKLMDISKAFGIVKDKKKFASWLNNESKSGEIMAIPDVIMKNATLAFIIYCIVLGMCLPNFAYRKWKNLKTKNSLGIQFDTMECFINFINNDFRKKCSIKNLITLLSKSKELSTKNFSSDISGIKSKVEYNFGYPLPDLKNVNTGFYILYDNLFRLNLCNKKDVQYVTESSLLIIEGMKCVAVAKGYVEIYKKLFTLQAMITQGVFDEDYYMLQYPHIKFNDLFLLKFSEQKIEVEEILNKLLQGRELKDALLVHKNILKINIKEFVAVIKNTGKINEEASDVDDEVNEDLMLNTEKFKNINTFKIAKNSLVTIRVKLEVLNKFKNVKAVHTCNILKTILPSWTVFITVDNQIHKEIVTFNANDTNDITFTFDAPVNKNSNEIKLHVMNGNYLKQNLEETIILRYF